jgi:hypothetical protein
MQLRAIKVLVRKNLGNYEHEEVELTADILEGEDTTDCMQALKAKAYKFFTLSKAEKVAAAEEQPKKAIEPKKEEVKSEAPKVAAVEKPKPSVKVEAPKAEVAKEEKAAKPKKVKAVPYDNTVDAHKVTLALYLKQTYGAEWSRKEGIAAFSVTLRGMAFLDSEGQIVQEFKDYLHTFFGA